MLAYLFHTLDWNAIHWFILSDRSNHVQFSKRFFLFYFFIYFFFIWNGIFTFLWKRAREFWLQSQNLDSNHLNSAIKPFFQTPFFIPQNPRTIQDYSSYCLQNFTCAAAIPADEDAGAEDLRRLYFQIRPLRSNFLRHLETTETLLGFLVVAAMWPDHVRSSWM